MIWLAGKLIWAYGGDGTLADDLFPGADAANGGASRSSDAPPPPKDPKQIAYEKDRADWREAHGLTAMPFRGVSAGGRAGAK